MPKKGGSPAVPAAGQLGALGEVITQQYPGQEQVDLAVIVDIPGSWFAVSLLPVRLVLWAPQQEKG